MKQLGLYVHIPFCVKKCNYCDFLSAPATKQVQKSYLDTLKKEIMRKRDEWQEYEVDTIFIGGGTPTSVPYEELTQVIECIKTQYHLTKDCEISMECNPGSVSFEALKAYKGVGVNRLSIGLQTTENELLQSLGRIHTYEQFLDTFSMARKVGFDNVNIDIMSALPKQTQKGYEETLKKIVALEPEHISAYSLIVEEGTPFFDMYQQDLLCLPSEEEERNMYYKTKEILEKAGYFRYEISNYAKNGYECRHNKRYWSRKEYLGLGLGASSFVKGTRYKNDDHLSSYMKEEGFLKQYEVEKLSEKDSMEEFMFLGLRMIEGVSKAEFHQRFRKDIEEVYGEVIHQLKSQALIEEKKERICLTEYGIDVSNTVFAEFLL